MSPNVPGQITYELPEREIMSCGHLACPGCGATLSMRMALKVLGPRTVLCIPACCIHAYGAESLGPSHGSVHSGLLLGGH